MTRGSNTARELIQSSLKDEIVCFFQAGTGAELGFLPAWVESSGSHSEKMGSL